ncbi:MAG: IclR family transcriptional regulator [Silicimonas sp.]|nr:IclR family transcriptional regulator [Silicimonas sp.]
MNARGNDLGRSDGTVGKALEVLEAVAAFERPVKFSELQENSHYPKATLYRLLQTLTNQNLVAHDHDTGTYTLGLRLIRLAHTAWEHASLAPVARPFLERLASESGESVHLAQLDNGQVIFVDKLKATDRFETLAQVGKVAPAYCTGVGKAMLAFLPPQQLEVVLQQQSFFPYTRATHRSPDTLLEEIAEVRREGIAFDREEHEEGINSIAAPIFISKGRVIGALSVATSTARQNTEGLQAFRERLLRTARDIGDQASSWHLA